MSAPPYMKLFWGDYHKATRHLTTAQHGAYFLLIGEAWRLGGALPEDDVILARWALCTDAEWVEMRPIVMAFFVLRRGKFVHDRVREELAHYDDISRKRKRAGKSGGMTSGGIDTGKPQAIAPQLPTEPEPEPEPYPVDKNSEDKSSAQGASDLFPEPDLDKRAWSEAVRILTASGASEKTARSFFGKLVSGAGVSAKALLPILTACEVAQTPDPQSYLTKAARGVSSRTNCAAKPRDVEWC